MPKKKVAKKKATREVRVVLPEAAYALVEFTQDDLPAIAAINQALVEFPHREVFAWHLSIHLEFEGLVDNGMPSREERLIVDPFGERLDEALKWLDDTGRVNVLFLARITWNGARELIYRVYDPEIANSLLSDLIASGDHPRPFNYRMEADPDWALAQWHLNATRGEITPPESSEPGELPLAKYGITEPIFEIFDEGPTAIGRLRDCRDELPAKPGMVYLGVENDIHLIKLAEDSIKAMLGGLLDDPTYYRQLEGVSEHVTEGLNRDLDQLWVAWREYRWTDD